MFKVKVNQETFEIEKKHNALLVNSDPLEWDVINHGNRQFSIIYKSKVYNAELLSNSPKEKKFTFRINNRIYETQARDYYDQLLKQLGLEIVSSSKIREIKAPMPGMVLNVFINEEEEVKKGDPVLVLEAMKMENVLKSPGEGKVKEIKVSKGDAVEKNQVLIIFD